MTRRICCKSIFYFMNYQNLSLNNIVAEVNGIVYTEEWVYIEGYNNNYKVSTFGRFKSMRDNKIMRQYKDKKKGYLSIGFSYNNIRKKYKCHRVVAKAFHPNPENKPEVNHDNFIKEDNFYLNLIWATGKENTDHAKLGGRRPTAKPKIDIKSLGRIVRNKQVVNTATGIVYDSVADLVKEAGCKNVKELRRRLGGERQNNTPYKYTGEYSSSRQIEKRDAYTRFHQLRKIIFGE